MDLSVVIPARNEQFLKNTVEDVLAASQADTEIIVIADGVPPNPPLTQHPKVSVILLPQSIGQRAATNLGARLASGRYIMKLDAHCSMASGFDLKLLEAAAELGREVVQIPAQKNLHVYDRLCKGCGARAYQGPMDGECPECKGRDHERVMVWKPRGGTTTTCWSFDETLKFQYDRLAQDGDLPEVMSSLGACFFMDREWFLELGGFDEAVGSWGQFGQELACKAWLSGGRQVVNKRTWFAHFFRVGGIGFPYPISGSDQEKAREYSRNLWRSDSWPGQVRPLRWLVDKFWPLAGWTEDARARLATTLPAKARSEMSKGIVYYTDGRLDEQIAQAARRTLTASGLPVVAVGLCHLDWPEARCVEMRAERGALTMFRQILQGLELLDTDVAFLCEHDVLYSQEHFAFTPPRADVFYYNEHVWKIDATEPSRPALHYPCKQTSGLVADRLLLIEHYRKRIERVEREGFTRRMGFEPGTHKPPRGIDDHQAEGWMSTTPNVDVRHGKNLTPSRWRKEQFRNQRYTRGWTESETVPNWGKPAEILTGL